MKKSIVILIAIFITGISISFIGIHINKQKKIESKIQNKEFELYTAKDEILGADVITIINKAISLNETNCIPKEQDDYYIENNENSIIVDIVLITDEERKQTHSYRMEKIAKVGIEQFISNFSTAKFNITKIEYHRLTSKIKYIEISQKY